MFSNKNNCILAKVIVFGGILIAASTSTVAQRTQPFAHETSPIGKTKDAQQRNAALLGGYDYSKYPTALTGYTGQDLQRIAFWRWEDAVRTRVGPRGNYKAGMTQLPDGKLVIASCRDNNARERTERYFDIFVYESTDKGVTWKEIGQTPLYGKEPSLTTLPDGSMLLTAQLGYFGPDKDAPAFAKRRGMPVSRSKDAGRTWKTEVVRGGSYPRNVIVEPDGSLLMIREGKRPNFEIGRSRDGGKTWEFSDGLVNWDGNTWYGEICTIRLKNGRLVAALRRQIPGTTAEGFEDTFITESTDGGKHWATPWRLTDRAEVHVYLTELRDGKLLATYSNYHLPWGVYTIISQDGGKTWDRDHPVQLALSADIWVGWPVTLQLPDGSLITSYAATTHSKEPPKKTSCEVVRWRLP